MYSKPLSMRIVMGLPRHFIMLFRLRTTRSAGNEKSTSMPQTFPVEVIQHVQQWERSSVHFNLHHGVTKRSQVSRATAAFQ